MRRTAAVARLVPVVLGLACAEGLSRVSAQSVGEFSAQPPSPKPSAQSIPTENDARIVGLGAPILTIPGQLANLDPEARVVEITRGAHGFGTAPYGAPPEGLDDTIRGATRASNVALIVRVTDRQSKLSQGQDWIVAAVAARILRVLKDDQSYLKESDTITFEEAGGDLVIEGRRVFTTDRFSEPTKADHEYLIFLDRSSDGRLTNTHGGGTTFELKDGRVERRLRLDIRTKGRATVDEVVAKVLAAR